jgi:multidrug efflux pump subunit AcrB
MNITELAIRRWQLTLVLFILLSALGYLTLTTIPRAVDPHFPMPVVVVTAAQPGANASEMEQTVTKPIEETMQGLEDVKEIVSTSNDGSAVIRAEFDWSGDPDRYFNDTVREVSAIRSRLPADLVGLDFAKMRTTNASVVQVALVSETASWRRLEKYGRDISEAFSRFPAVREAQIAGLSRPEITIAVKTARLAELRLPPSAIADALRLGSADVASGSVTSGSRRFNVDAGGAFRDLDTIRNLPVRSDDGSILKIGNIANVTWGAEEARSRTFHNGKRAIWITANQKLGTDATRLRDQLVKEMEGQKKLLPPDMKLVLQFDQSQAALVRIAA